MVGRRLRLPALEGAELSVALLAATLTAALALVGVHKLGAAGILAPLALVAVGILLARPVLAVTLVVGLVILCEGPTFGILTFTSHLYTNVYKYLSVLDLLVAIAVVSVGFDVARHRRALWWPGPLRLPFAILALAMICGVVVGSANASGAGLRYVIVSEHVLAYLLFLPIAVANLNLDRRAIRQMLLGLLAFAAIKSVLGLVEVIGHYGAAIEGTSTLTYYEPAANWLIMLALLGIAAFALLARSRPPVMVLLASPLLVACLLLSYRRSFWIAAVLALLLVLLLGISPGGRRLLLPAGLAVAAAIWLLGSIAFQAQLPIVKRAESLTPAKLEANREDRYRLDERANVLGEIGEHPIAGLGMTIPWAADVQPLSVEHEEGRQYVHFAALWFWLKLGLLGLCAYVALLLGSMVLAWRVWRSGSELLVRAFGLASLAGVAGLAVMDTTASFTGVDARFTVLFAAQLGLLALLAQPEPDGL
jgi:O-antigen ligase